MTKEFKVKVEVKLKSVILDPQGKAVLAALHDLGFVETEDARIGKLIELKVKGSDAESVKEKAEEMCRKILANPVIEDFVIKIESI